jgi:hypothetical protein
MAALVVIIYIVVLFLSIFTYTHFSFYKIATVHKLSYKFKINLLRLAPMNGVVSKVIAERTTVVRLTDNDLDELISLLLQDIGNTNQITVAQLQSFGLHTQTVVDYLINLGYTIIS